VSESVQIHSEHDPLDLAEWLSTLDRNHQLTAVELVWLRSVAAQLERLAEVETRYNEAHWERTGSERKTTTWRSV
jgi:hypothetical protein